MRPVGTPTATAARRSPPGASGFARYGPGELPAGADHEELVVCEGERSGATMAIAVHSTALGPALGGARMWSYESSDELVDDALRLAGAMTLKAAAAGLDLGGGKGVIGVPAGAPPSGAKRRALLLDFAELVDSLEGRYVTAEDVGTSAGDMTVIATRTRHVSGLPLERGGSGDPSPFTALGVEAAMRAACRHALGARSLRGRRVAIVGLGHVGEHLARSLVQSGAQVVASDIDLSRRAVAESMGASWIEPGRALAAECDVLAPCAVGGAIGPAELARLRCRVICGAANNQLANEGLASALADRGVLYAPDFIANAGGLISIFREVRGYDGERARSLALGIEATMDGVLAAAETRGATPLEAARELARERLDAARG